MVNPQTVEKLMETAKAIGYGKIPPYQHSECFTIGAFDLILINATDKGSAFELLQAVCNNYATVKNDDKFLEGYVYLLRQLAGATDTTQLPEGMTRIIRENPTQTNGLQEWYRLKGQAAT